MSFGETIKMQYHIICDAGTEQLAIKVEESMKQGWIPMGGIACDDKFFYQAMTKNINSNRPYIICTK